MTVTVSDFDDAVMMDVYNPHHMGASGCRLCLSPQLYDLLGVVRLAEPGRIDRWAGFRSQSQAFSSSSRNSANSTCPR